MFAMFSTSPFEARGGWRAANNAQNPIETVFADLHGPCEVQGRGIRVSTGKKSSPQVGQSVRVSTGSERFGAGISILQFPALSSEPGCEVLGPRQTEARSNARNRLIPSPENTKICMWSLPGTIFLDLKVPVWAPNIALPLRCKNTHTPAVMPA